MSNYIIPRLPLDFEIESKKVLKKLFQQTKPWQN